MTLLAGITVAPRGRKTAMDGQDGVPASVDYAESTIRQLRETAGGRDIRVVVFPTSPDTEVPDGADEIVPADRIYSVIGNSDRLLRHLVDHGDGKPFLQCQDDLLLCRNAVARMCGVADSGMGNAGLVGFYTPPRIANAFSANRLMPGAATWGMLCSLWHPGAAEDFLGIDFERRRQDHGTGKSGARKWDVMVGDWMRLGRFQTLRHVPCLVQHAGDVSSIGNGTGVRRTTNFRQDWDAMVGSP